MKKYRDEKMSIYSLKYTVVLLKRKNGLMNKFTFHNHAVNNDYFLELFVLL